MIINAALSALLQLLALAVVPLIVYWLYHRRRHGRSFRDAARRAGLQMGDRRYLLYAAAVAVCGCLALVVWTPPLEHLTRPGSAQSRFAGLGLGPTALVLALLNGAIQTALAEEILFRGLIAGSLARRLSMTWANLIQATIFFLPHLAILWFVPELWPVLPLVLLGALFFGWLRIRSRSILGPWILHAAGNVTMALLVAART
jgi:membrane protease YdiL (CAAX protease family)